MVLRHKLGLEMILLMILAAAFSSVFAWYYNQNSWQKLQIVTPVFQTKDENTLVPTTVPTTAPHPMVDKSSQISPDGKEILDMQVTHNLDQTESYIFTAHDADGNNERQIYATDSAELRLSIPFNTWSPDDKYVFIKKGNNNAMVFLASGEPISSDQPYLEVANTFQVKKPDVTIGEITGWAGYREIVVNAVNSEGKQESSYWYEVPSEAIWQLSTKF